MKKELVSQRVGNTYGSDVRPIPEDTRIALLIQEYREYTCVYNTNLINRINASKKQYAIRLLHIDNHYAL